ncbi:MAG: Transcriptional regulator, XRE family [Candidatus Woesebacteria bacterium GW2011_GWB1_38_8]|uniref:Transcriptional regulator, XRE family n=1 Tax=Candidatus Woesebacteria bacterium GW2011_GWB1_38_8 TaxID=1618570 RepID=A0A0G0P7C0_9BACT|nr:MAG: Transcriptional regulator, XRE family [Candidatus Woesebacteria bacterium GW2011_GWB1_38_8]
MDKKEWEVQAKKFGRKLAMLRTERKVTQEDLSWGMQVDRTYISLLERGLRNPTLKRLWQISKVLKVPLTELVKF